MSTTAEITLWGKNVGAVSWDSERGHAFMEYDRRFATSGIQIAPLHMPLGPDIYSFPGLPVQSFHGLPGLLADSLPDRFGNAIIDSWLAAQGRSPDQFNPVERLCYTGTRGMGALEFHPTTGPQTAASTQLDIGSLVSLANEVLDERGSLSASMASPVGAVRDILRVGTSAGGARAKAVIAWNEETNEIRSGQLDADSGFSYWMLKFDGITGNRDKEIADPKGYGMIEYAYYLMARAAGITMMPSRLLHEGGRSHFMTRRFDRRPDGKKIHMQSLGGLAHLDFNQAGAHSYEEAMQVIKRLEMPMSTLEEQFRRMVFNLVARNQDDHVKNIAFLMDPSGRWALSPAYDVIYSFNPGGSWTASHQMTVNGKRDAFTVADLRACADSVSMKKTAARDILEKTIETVREWPRFAQEAGVTESKATRIAATHRIEWP